MNVWLLDVLCAVLVVIGIGLALRSGTVPRSPAAVQHASDRPQTYILRIAGVMLAAFGSALGIMATVFHFA